MTPEILDEIKAEALKEFELLSRVYRPSFRTRRICDYLKERVRELRPGTEVYEDQYRANLVNDALNPNESSGNIWWDVPANAPALEGNEPIILQAHMDMVIAFTNDDVHNQMQASGVELEYHDNGTLTSLGNQTSLGADNGIGIGTMLAITKSDNFKHGPIRCIVTTDEEEGMIGASYLGLTKNGEKGSPVQGFKYLINNDNSFDGEIIISTAGAVISFYTVPKDLETKPLDTKLNVFTINLSGLLGGHDGDWIATHATAVRLVGEILRDINSNDSFRIIEYASPDSDGSNLLHTHSFATFCTNLSFEEVQKIVADHDKQIRHDFPAETGLKIQTEIAKLPDNVEIRPFSHETSTNIVNLICELMFGPYTWKNKEMGWVETSGNMGPIYIRYDNTKEGGKDVWCNPSMELQVLCRSCNNEHIQKIIEESRKMAKTYLGSDDLDHYQMRNMYYGWPGDEDQSFINIAKEAFESKGVKWTTRHLHGGLEVSWFKHFNPELNMVSIGAEIHNMHDTQETLYTGTMDGVIAVTLSCIEHMRFIGKK